MSAEDEPKKAKTGYRNPPKSGQFQKGVSGNPRGRPRKRRDEPALPDDRTPTLREVIRAEINRTVPIIDGSGRHTIPMKEAVFRALGATAIADRGVLAQRTYIELTMKEEELQRKENERTFKFWREYKTDTAAFIASGKPLSFDGPDPDDVKLDWGTQEVRIVGPIDNAAREEAKFFCDIRDLSYEMSFYHDEMSHMWGKDNRVTHIGLYFGLYLLCDRAIWPRMRSLPKGLESEIWGRTVQGLRSWGNDLRSRCAALGIIFLPRKKGAVPPMIPLSKLGFEQPIQLPPMPKKRHSRRRRQR